MTSLRCPMRILILLVAILPVTLGRPEEQVFLDALGDEGPFDPHMLDEQVFDDVTEAPVEPEEEVLEPFDAPETYPKKVTDETYPKKFKEGLSELSEPATEAVEPETPEEVTQEEGVMEEEVEEPVSPLPLEEEGEEVVMEEEEGGQEVEGDLPQQEEEPETVSEEPGYAEEEIVEEEEVQEGGEGGEEEEQVVPEEPERSDVVEEDSGPQEYQPEPPAEPEEDVAPANETTDDQEPVVMPVTEGKNRSGHEGYDLPKELMPIHPGGGSKFEDLGNDIEEETDMASQEEEENVAKEDAKENGNSHSAEGLYSSSGKLKYSVLLLSLASFFVRKLV